MPNTFEGNILLGKDCVVNGVSTLSRIKISNASEKSPIHASNLSGGVARSCGIKMLAGYMWGFGDTPPVFPNDLFDLKFTLDGDNVARNESVRCLGIEVIVEPYDEQKLNATQWIAYLGGAGYDFVFSTGSAPTDTSTPAIYCTKALSLKLNSVAIDYVTAMRLKIMAISSPTWPSNSSGVAFYPPGDIDWNLLFTRNVNKFDRATVDLDSVNSVLMQGYSSTDWERVWDLEWGKLGLVEGDWNRQTPKPLTQDYLLEKCVSGSDIGHILSPTAITGHGSTTCWP